MRGAEIDLEVEIYTTKQAYDHQCMMVGRNMTLTWVIQ
jgi:hypothetical protein